MTLVLAGVLAWPAAAADKDEVRIASVEAHPWSWVGQDGSVKGAFPEIVAEMSRRTGISIRVDAVPFPRIDRELETGNQDCVIVLWSDARSRIVERGEDVYMMTFGVIARRGVRLTAYEDLKSLTVSVVRNLPIERRFDADPEVRKDFDKDYSMGLHKIVHGRLEAIAGAIPTIVQHARRDGLEEHLGDRVVLSRIPLTLQCAKQSPRLGRMDILNRALASMRADGALAAILERHGYQ